MRAGQCDAMYSNLNSAVASINHSSYIIFAVGVHCRDAPGPCHHIVDQDCGMDAEGHYPRPLLFRFFVLTGTRAVILTVACSAHTAIVGEISTVLVSGCCVGLVHCSGFIQCSGFLQCSGFVYCLVTPLLSYISAWLHLCLATPLLSYVSAPRTASLLTHHQRRMRDKRIHHNAVLCGAPPCYITIHPAPGGPNHIGLFAMKSVLRSA